MLLLTDVRSSDFEKVIKAIRAKVSKYLRTELGFGTTIKIEDGLIETLSETIVQSLI